jgi:hypothetical protein
MEDGRRQGLLWSGHLRGMKKLGLIVGETRMNMTEVSNLLSGLIGCPVREGY